MISGRASAVLCSTECTLAGHGSEHADTPPPQVTTPPYDAGVKKPAVPSPAEPKDNQLNSTGSWFSIFSLLFSYIQYMSLWLLTVEN